MSDIHHPQSSELYQCTEKNQQMSLVGSSIDDRHRLYKESVEDSSKFWNNVAKENFFWHKLWDESNVRSGSFDKTSGPIDIKWFMGARTNVCFNAIDRHLPKNKDRVAFYWEGNEPSKTMRLTYGDMQEQVISLANVLKSQYGIQKGDRVGVYLPMIPFAVVSMLACARIGAVVTVVFGGFSAQALSSRLIDAQAKVLITADASSRANKPILLKAVADHAMDECADAGLEVKCLVYENEGRHHCTTKPERDTWVSDALEKLSAKEKEECPVEWMEAEDPLFLLYTSGSTGKPKAILHTTAGYMVYAATTFKYTFDYHPEDVFFCTADIGWITGHSYVVYGPMINCATQVLFEGLPSYPDSSRWWQMVDRYKVSIFYTAPTAVRSLMQVGNEFVTKTDRSSLRILGSVGEPINSEAWKWFHEVVGGGHVDIVDTWWQTETGGHLITPMPGCTPQKPGSATFPFFGIQPAILDPMTHEELQGEAKGLLMIKEPWPGVVRSIYGDHDRYEKTYFNINGYYLTGDGAHRDKDGYIWITGRVDDVLNVSGHRIGTSEVEEAVNSHPAVVESAVVGVPHSIKGEAIYVYVTFHEGTEITAAIFGEVKTKIREIIGPLATPDHMQPAQTGLPKTRSGKIVRRVLRKVAAGDVSELGDTSTLLNPGVVEELLEQKKQWVKM